MDDADQGLGQHPEVVSTGPTLDTTDCYCYNKYEQHRNNGCCRLD